VLAVDGEGVMDTPSRSEASPRPDPSPTIQRRTSDPNIFLAAKGGGVTFAGALFAYGSWLLIGILLARFLGADQYGLYTLALSPITIAAGFAGLGLAPALVRYIPIFAGRRDTEGLWGTLQVGLGLTMVASLLVGIGFFALATLLAVELFNEPRLVPLLRLGSLMIPLMAMSSMLSAATRGFKKMQYTVISQKISQPAIRLVLIVALALFVGLNAANALAAYLLALAIVATMLFYFLNRLFALRRPLRAGRRNPREMLSFSLPVYLTRLIKTFRGSIQMLLLGAFHAVTTVGVFAVASKVNMIGKMFHESIVTTSAPIVSDLYDKGKHAQLSRFYQTMTKWTFTVNLPLFLIVQLFPGAILSIFGREYVGGATALSILAWGNLVDASTGICGVVIDMTGKTGLKLVNTIAVFGILLGLKLLLTPRWGLLGAATAVATANAAINLLRLAEVYVLYRLLPYNVGFLKPVVAGLIALAAGWTLNQWFLTKETLVSVAINITLLLAVYLAAILLLGLDQEDRAVLNHIGGRLKARFQR
jgi:O-antigen/teichoic acid export membrane protein